jgi:hypothetical protein
MPLHIRTTTRGKNIDCLIKMRGSTYSTSDEEPIASMKLKHKKKTEMNAGGSNHTIDQTGYVYPLFACIVLAESDYLSKVGTRVKH